MFCPKCGKINPDNSEICSGCSAVLHMENDEKSAPKNKKWLRAIFGAIAILFATAIVIMLLKGCGNA